MSTRQTLIATLRELTGWVAGWIVMFKQAGILFPEPAKPNDTMIWAAVLLVGGPGLWQVVLAIFGRPPIGSSSSESPHSSPSPSSSGASSTGGETR